MAGRDDNAGKSTRKLGRGLSDVSHVFISGQDRPKRPEQAPPPAPLAFVSDEAREDAPEDSPQDSGVWLPRATYIAITSGDRVRGKTFLAANLAFGLGQRGRRVALVSADGDRPDLFEALGGDRLAAVNGPGPAGDAFGSIAIADAVTGPAAGLAALDAAARDAQTVLVDTAPRGEASRTIWSAATLVLVVAEPGAEELKASYVAVKRVHSSGCPRIGLVINRVRSYAQGEACFRKLAEISRKFLKINLRNYGYVFLDDAVPEALRQTVPLVMAFPDSRAVRCLEEILGLIAMDESAIARRRKEVKLTECALKRGKLEALKS